MNFDDDTRRPLNGAYAIVSGVCLLLVFWAGPRAYAAWAYGASDLTRIVWTGVSILGFLVLAGVAMTWIATSGPGVRSWWNQHRWWITVYTLGITCALLAWIIRLSWDPAIITQHLGQVGYMVYSFAWWVLVGTSICFLVGPVLEVIGDLIMSQLAECWDTPPIDPSALDQALLEEE